MDTPGLLIPYAVACTTIPKAPDPSSFPLESTQKELLTPNKLFLASQKKVPCSIFTKLKIFSWKFPFQVILKLLEINVYVVIVVGSDHLNHLDLTLVRRLL